MNSKTLLALIPVAALAACTSSGGGATHDVSVSLKVVGPGAAFAADACGNSLSSAQLVLRDIELHPVDTGTAANTTETSGGDGIDAGDDALQVGPTLIDITAADFNGVLQQSILSAQVPAGSYDSVKFTVHKIDSGNATDAAAAAANPDLAAMMNAGLSVKILGISSAGGAFEFDSSLDASQEQAVNVVVGNSTTGIDGVTLSIDPNAWFQSNGACLDPTNASNQSAIEDNIRASISLEEDDNHDGIDDSSQSH